MRVVREEYFFKTFTKTANSIRTVNNNFRYFKNSKLSKIMAYSKIVVMLINIIFNIYCRDTTQFCNNENKIFQQIYDLKYNPAFHSIKYVMAFVHLSLVLFHFNKIKSIPIVIKINYK